VEVPELWYFWFQKLFLSYYFHGKRAKINFKTFTKIIIHTENQHIFKTVMCIIQ